MRGKVIYVRTKEGCHDVIYLHRKYMSSYLLLVVLPGRLLFRSIRDGMAGVGMRIRIGMNVGEMDGRELLVTLLNMYFCHHHAI